MSPKQPHTELQEELRSGDHQPTPDSRIAELEAEVARLTRELEHEETLRRREHDEDMIGLGAAMDQIVEKDIENDRLRARVRVLEEQLAALTSPARRAAAHTAILNLLAQHHPDAHTTGHGGTGDARALSDDAAAYTDAAINALVGGA